MSISPDFLPAGSEYGWQRGPLYGVLRLRPPVFEVSPEGRELLRRHARDARVAVEIGVAEGGSARAIREAIDPNGTLHLIDPYPPGRLGIGLARLIARRVVREVPRGHVIWRRQRSQDAVTSWTEPIDFLFVDGDNSFEGVSRDWADWSPHMRVGGVVVLHGAHLTDGNWVTADYGPARLVREQITDNPRWTLIEGVDAAVALRRVA